MPAPLRVCFVASEVAPLAKTGGLADVASALPRFLHGKDHDVRLFMPMYSRIGALKLGAQPVASVQDVPVDLGSHRYRFSLFTVTLPGSTLAVYLVGCGPLYDRPGIYSSGPDEHLRFMLLSRAALDSCQRMQFEPHIVHCNDWHTGFMPMYLKSVYAWDRLFARTKSVLTIHNIGYQGLFSSASAGDVGLGSATHLLHQDDLRAGRINSLRHGIMYADAITTVSPTYANEIRSDQYGMGLQDTLRARGDAVLGILNGVDYAEWNPETDRYAPHHFSANDLAGKEKVKQDLLKRMQLRSGRRTALLGIVSRMTVQKGFDLVFDPLPRVLAQRDLVAVVLGSGEPRYEEFFARLQQRFPSKVVYHRGYHDELAHLIEAGSDMFLMPSMYEPCGLNQMYSLRYGTVPIVRRTGGLADSVQPFDPATGQGTGIVFNDYNSEAVSWALHTALTLYQKRALWTRMVLNGMAQDFSWERQGGIYVDLYRRLVKS
jgi:starch synthase